MLIRQVQFIWFSENSNSNQNIPNFFATYIYTVYFINHTVYYVTNMFFISNYSLSFKTRWTSLQYICLPNILYIQPRQPLVTSDELRQPLVTVGTDRYYILQWLAGHWHRQVPVATSVGHQWEHTYTKRLKIKNGFKHRVWRQLKLMHIFVHVHVINQYSTFLE